MSYEDIKIIVGNKEYELIDNITNKSDCDLCEISQTCESRNLSLCGNNCYLVRTNKDKVYIAGAIEGHDLDERKKAFRDAAMKLQKQGYETYNPFDNGLPDDAPRAEHIRADLKMMLQCDYIYLLRGYEYSRGACRERDVAIECGISLMYEEDDQNA